MRMWVTLAVLLAGTAAAPSLAEEAFDPLASCTSVLAEDAGAMGVVVGFWAYGFLDAATGQSHRVTAQSLAEMQAALRERCAAEPDASLADIARMVAAMETSAEPAAAAEGRMLLEQFLEPTADHGALTLALSPTPEDVRAVYAEPLAGKLIEAYQRLFAPGAAIRPKPGQTELLSIFATTGALKRGDPVLDEFPGGYRDVLEYVVGDVPIMRFKFVEPGETLGLAFDGLILVNGHWVFMPKPWSVLTD